MSIKKKLILMGICVGIILTVLTVNVVRRIQSNEQDASGNNYAMENIITRAEAYRLLSYLEYNKADRESLSAGFTYADKKMSGWYDSYVNAVCKMGLIGDKVTISPKEALTYGSCKKTVDKLILKNPDYQKAYTGLSFDFSKSKKKMLIPDFLELYKALLAVTSKEDQIVKEDTLLVLGKEVTEDGKNRMVTDKGKYYYLDAQSYVEYSKQAAEKAKTSKDQAASENSTDKKASSGKTAGFIDQYMDKGINVLVCDQEIIYVSSITTDKIVVHNAWIRQGKEQKVDTFINGIDKSFTTVSSLKTSIEKVIGDITIQNQKIVKIKVKPDMIKGKVLRSGDDFVEIEGYGKVPLEEDFQIYKIYGELSTEPTGSILVGYKNTDFIVSDGKISAALITESIKAQDIRVLIKTNGYKDIYHDKAEFTATSDFTVSTKETKHTYKKGEKVTIKPGDKMFEDGRITVKTSSEKGKIQLLSVERSCGNPRYRGSVEIAEDNGKLIIVNELPLEEYLYAVIPSEMPTSYGNEALKVQAVCARSYAYRHLMANSLSRYGAHVDDSAAYQVYNNISENEESILAVKDTYGEVIKYDNNVITAYYFSTSCGHTTAPTDVWANCDNMPYLSGKLLLNEEEDQGVKAQSTEAEAYENLSSEKSFKSFIEADDITTYDSGFNWYRWKVTMDTQDLKKVIDHNLGTRYQAGPDLILTMTKKAKGKKKAEFDSIPVDTVGNIVDISVSNRESSGIVSEIIIKGSKNTIKVRTEYNIRALLAPAYDSVIRKDNSKIDNLSMLPSAFFMIDRKEKDGKLKSIKLLGGGYGHGVGMSQNAVKTLTDSGQDYKQIVSYFYKGTELGSIYE